MRPIPAFAFPKAVAFAVITSTATDAAQHNAELRRPRLLMAAARHGMGDYRRTRDLLRLLGYCPGSAVAAGELADLEAVAEEARRAGSPTWSCTRHVELLIALLAERAVSGG